MPGMSVPSPGDATMQTMWPPEAALLPLLPKDQAHRPTVAFDLDGTLIGSSDDPAAAQPYGGACSVIATYEDPAGGLGKRYR